MVSAICLRLSALTLRYDPAMKAMLMTAVTSLSENETPLTAADVREPTPGAARRQRSSRDRPVLLAILASIRGPISSSSWTANTKSGQEDRARVRCEPDWRLTCQPRRSRAASTIRAFDEGQLLKRL